MEALIGISADSPEALTAAAATLARDLAQRPGTPVADVARELHAGVPDRRYRRAFVARDTTEAARTLRKRSTGADAGEAPSVYFLFPGVGDHYAGMARELYDAEPEFRHWLDTCAELLSAELGTDIRDTLYPAVTDTPKPATGHVSGIDLAALLGRRDDEPAPIDRTRLAQPIVFAVEYALAKMLLRWGIRPAGMLGYSIGEYVAAALAEVLTLPQACTLVARRAELIEALPSGAMTVVMLGEADLAGYLDDELSLAAVDGPNLCVAAGPVHAVERLEKRLTADGTASLRATARHAFHSTMLAPIAEPLTELLQGFELRAPRIPLLSNVTGTWLTAGQATDPGYWVRHTCGTVRLHDDLTELWRDPAAIALEVGAGQMLTGLAAQHPGCPRPADPPVLSTVPGAGTGTGDMTALLTVAGRLWQAGAPLDWTGPCPAEGR